MKKLKRILVSLILALIILMLISILYKTVINSNLTTAYMVLVDAEKGMKIGKDNILKVQLAVNKKDMASVTEYATLEQITSMYTTCKMSRGDFIQLEDLSIEQGLVEEEHYEYIAIPFEEAEDTLAYYNISKGSVVNLYFTAKTEDINNVLTILSDKNKLYSSTGKNGIVTVNLYNNIQVIETLDANGQRVRSGKISQIIFKIPKEDSVLIANLKANGTFSLTLIE